MMPEGSGTIVGFYVALRPKCLLSGYWDTDTSTVELRQRQLQVLVSQLLYNTGPLFGMVLTLPHWRHWSKAQEGIEAYYDFKD